MGFLGFPFKTHVKNRTIRVQAIPDPEQRFEQLRIAIDEGGFQKLVVFSAGMGFLTGAYEIFATSMTIPMIKLAYYHPYNKKMPDTHETLLRSATLIGAIIGQLAFGFLADLYGRRKMYGVELLVMIGAICGIVMSSSGAEESMHIFPWLFFWRFVMGIGVGADYPVSATITAEFAPTRHRARMIATVFFMQPVAYLLATLVTLAVTVAYRDSIPRDLSTTQCDGACVRAVDRCWRIIIGVGAVPALVAIYFRRTIPESPLFTAVVLNRPDDAKKDILAMTANPVEHQGDNLPNDTAANDDAADDDDAEQFGHRCREYWKDFKKYFVQEGHWRQLLGVSLAWLLLDMSFYALGSSSTTIVTKIFDSIPVGASCPTIQGSGFQGPACPPLPNGPGINVHSQSIYAALFANTWRSLIVVCAGSLLGGAGMILLIKSHSPVKLQLIGFIILMFLFTATGLFLRLLSDDNVTIPTVIMYFLAQVFFQIGPNFTTFMLSVELFQARQRAFAHGIAAASGKVGASVFQIFIQFVRFHDGTNTFAPDDLGTIWLGYTLFCFLPTTLAGAIVTYKLIPETRLKGGRKNRTLEELGRLGGTPPDDTGWIATIKKGWRETGRIVKSVQPSILSSSPESNQSPPDTELSVIHAEA